MIGGSYSAGTLERRFDLIESEITPYTVYLSKDDSHCIAVDPDADAALEPGRFKIVAEVWRTRSGTTRVRCHRNYADAQQLLTRLHGHLVSPEQI